MNWKTRDRKYFMNWKAMSRIPLETGYLLNWVNYLQVHADITGGWEGYVNGGLYVAFYTNPTTGSPYWMYTGSANNESGDITTAIKVDVTDIKTLRFTVYIWGGQSYVQFGIRDTKTGAFVKSVEPYVYNDVSTVIDVDVSAYTGDYYIGLRYTTGKSVRFNALYIIT